MDIQIYLEPDSWEPGDALVKDKVVSKEQAHDEGLLHLSTHLLIVNRKGEILCRKRPENDFRYAGFWTTTIGTHVELESDYKKTIEKFLPTGLELRWIGEFATKDEWENEINGLFVTQAGKEDLPDDFLRDRVFSDQDEIAKAIHQGKTTPHLKEAYLLWEHNEKG